MPDGTLPEGPTPQPAPETGGKPGAAQQPLETEIERLLRESAVRVRQSDEASRQRVAAVEASFAAQRARETAATGGPNAGVQGLEKIAGPAPAQEQAAAGVGGVREPPQPPGGTAPAPEPEEGPPRGSRQVQQARTEIENFAEDVREAERQRREELRSLSVEDIDDDIAYQRARQQGAEQTLNTPRLEPETYREARRIRDDAARQADELRVMKRQVARSGRAPADREQIEAAVRAERQQAEEAARYTKIPLSDLKDEKDIADSTASMLEKRVNETDLRDLTYGALQVEARRARTKADELKRIYGAKEATQREADAKAATETHARDLKELQGKVGPVDEIQGIVDTLQGEFTGIKGEIKKNAEDLAKATTEDERTRLKDELAGFEKRAVEVGKRLVEEKDALAAARKRVREEKGLAQTASPETVRILSIEEFNKLSPAEKTKYFVELGDAHGKPLKTEYDAIIKKLGLASENLSFEDAGKLVRYLSESLFNKEGVKAAVRDLAKVNVYNPELAQAVMDRVTAREDFQKALKEKYPGDWEKVLRFAKKYKGWLMILLLILAAGTAAATVAVGAGAGVIVGVSGASAGARGVFEFGRRAA